MCIRDRANALNDKPLPVYGTGENVRDWLYVEDHCKASAFFSLLPAPGPAMTALVCLETLSAVCAPAWAAISLASSLFNPKMILFRQLASIPALMSGGSWPRY